MKYKSGDILFLTKRTNKKPLYRWFVSNSIAFITKKKKQKINEVKVHSAIIYKYKKKLYVRDMDSNGDEHYLLDDYVSNYKDRIEIISMFKMGTFDFNKSCLTNKVKYDYLNTFVWQLVRGVFNKWTGKNTPYVRMCAEDVQRCYNIIDPIFKTPEKTNPNELYFKIQDLKNNK